MSPYSAIDWMEATLTVNDDLQKMLQYDIYINQLQQNPDILQQLLLQLIDRPYQECFMTGDANNTAVHCKSAPNPANVTGLLEYQNKSEDLSSLPATDASTLNPPEHTTLTSKSNVKYNIVDTQLTYYHGIVDLKIDASLLLYLPLFCQLLLKLDTATLSNQELTLRIRQNTSGINVSPLVVPSLYSNTAAVKLYLSSYSDGKLSKTIELIKLILESAIYDNEHAVMMINKTINTNLVQIKNQIPATGHLFALKYAHQFTSSSSKLDELLSGLTQYKHMEAMSKTDSKQIIQKLLKVQKLITKGIKSHFIISSSILDLDYNNGVDSSYNFKLNDFEQCSTTIPIKLSLPVNYLAQSQYMVPYDHKDSPYYGLISKLMNPYLHEEIREKGGAYGGASTYNSLNGTMGFYTYRDPNNDFKVFGKGYDYLGAINDEKLNLAKWSLLREMGRPIGMDRKGLSEYLYGIKNVQVRHEQVKSADKSYLIELADRIKNNNRYQTILN
eukprot:NODE_553_length_6771_cov_0.191847.p1 type:complete len:500 gc:universal NODE_553_length_6771_cov_0.191847:1507-3006(+)